MEACIAKWLTPQTLDLEVWGSSLAHRIVSLGKELCSTLSPFPQVYDIHVLLGVDPAINWHPIQGGVEMLLGMLHANKTRIRSGCLGLCSPLPSPNLAQSKNCFIFSSTGYQ